MNPLLLSAYPWIKALHVIAVISWMAGLLYLPRLFVYHCETEAGSDQSVRFLDLLGPVALGAVASICP